MEYRKLTDLVPLKGNPRTIKTPDFEKLCKSISENKEYFEARPIILSDRTGELVILAGNMRYKAAKELKLKTVPTHLISGLTEAKEREIIIRDNVQNGEWDFDILANEWDAGDLAEWGVNVPEFTDYSDKNKEIDTDDFDSEMTIKLKYTEADYKKVREQLSKIASTPEQAVWKLLKND